MSNVGWLVTQKFVILVPDPIAFAPRPALLDPGEPCEICQYTSFWLPFAGLFVTPRNKDDTGDGVPTDQLSHNHCDCTDSHCNSHIVTSYVFVLVLHSDHKSIGGRSSSATSSRRRARRARPREARFVTLANLTRQSRAMVFAWWNRCIISPHCAADSGAGGELHGRASLVTVDVLTRHICSVSLCLCVPMERAKYVWLVAKPQTSS